jgi:lipoprotein-anchoring transpeptidase ErfK/SrfK
MRKAGNALAQEKFKDAKELAEAAILKLDKESDDWHKAAEILSKANTALFKSDIPCKDKILYTVKKGDALQTIARKFNTTVAAIQKSNNMGPMDFTIHDGQTLCIYKGDWKITVKKRKYKLYLYNGDKLFKFYVVGTGRQDRTPEGTFKIATKQANPTWYYKGKKYEFGTKENVLGTHWMSLRPTGETNPGLKGYGIHGTWEPESVGKMSSNGCIRMKNDEVKELFSIVPLNTEVIIEE